MGSRVVKLWGLIAFVTFSFSSSLLANTTLCYDSLDVLDLEDVIDEAQVCADTKTGCEAFSCLDVCVKSQKADPLECAMLCNYTANTATQNSMAEFNGTLSP